MLPKLFVSILVSCFSFLISASPALATTYYVSPTGSDSNPGTESQPLASISKAALKTKPGDTVYVRSGTYTQTVRIETKNSGTADSPIRLMAYPGETPVIDGQNNLGGGCDSVTIGVLLKILGDYIHVSGLEVKNSCGMCVNLYGQHDKVSNMNVHHCNNNGILIQGDYGIVEDSEVWWAASYNKYGVTGKWASGLSAARAPHNAIIRRNYVHDNWGEGVSSYEATHTTIEDNIIHDNYSTNIYVSDTTNTLVQRNIVYTTPESVVQKGARVGILIGDERYNPPSSNNTIVNNLVYRTNKALYAGSGRGGLGGLKNVLIAHNTFLNSQSDALIKINPGAHTNSRIVNNIFLQEDSLPIALGSSSALTGITFANNLWSKTPPSHFFSENSLVGNPLLLARQGNISPDWLRLQPNSPAINKAVLLPEVPTDFFKQSRGQFPDIGAYEYLSSSSKKPGDLNSDGRVNLSDYNLLVAGYGTKYTLSDYNQLVANYGT